MILKARTMELIVDRRRRRMMVIMWKNCRVAIIFGIGFFVVWCYNKALLLPISSTMSTTNSNFWIMPLASDKIEHVVTTAIRLTSKTITPEEKVERISFLGPNNLPTRNHHHGHNNDHRGKAKTRWMEVPQQSSQQRRQQQQQASPNRVGCPQYVFNITSWEEVQRCVNGRKEGGVLRHDKPYMFRLVGERHSGTKFIVGLIRSCFRSASIDIQRDFTRSKHFFQVPPDPADNLAIVAKKYRYDDPSRVIVISIHRNPFDWVHAMIEQPYHTPNHASGFQQQQNGSWWPVPLHWTEFITRPWSMPRSSLDLERIATNNTQGNICVFGMTFDEVVPCEIRPHELPEHASLREHIPIYELKRDQSGEPFATILDMRAAKIRHFVQEIPQWKIGGYLAVRYDDLLQNGTQKMLLDLAKLAGLAELPNKCQPKGPQPERIGRRKLPVGLQTWISENMDQEAERLIGYA